MAQRPDVGALSKQVTKRLKQINDQVILNQRIVDELLRLRDAMQDLERAVRSRSGDEPAAAARTTGQAPRRRSPKKARAAKRPVTPSGARATKRRPAPRGQNQAKILAALKGQPPMTASQIAKLTGIAAPTVSTTLNTMAKNGELIKAERGYRHPGSTPAAD